MGVKGICIAMIMALSTVLSHVYAQDSYLQTGTECDAVGYADITDYDQCFAAAVALGVKSSDYRINGGKNRHKKPQWCYFDYGFNHLRFNPHGQGEPSNTRTKLCVLTGTLKPTTAAPTPSPTTAAPTPSPTTAAPTPSPTTTVPTTFTPTASVLTFSGTMRKWHKITIDIDGPSASESANPSPFLEYRLDITFTKGTTSMVIPGYFAADGDAANTGATSGSVWRTHFVPPSTGEWTLTVSFRKGTNVAVNGGGSTVANVHGVTATFVVADTDKTGNDFRGKGMLRYVGKRYPQFDNGEYFLKAGPDSPENFLGYTDFDGTTKLGKFSNGPQTSDKLHHYTPHAGDWKNGDPTWMNGKGKNIIGAINYLASTGSNTMSFITYNYAGDGQDVWPFTSGTNRDSYDCSKLDQWNIVMEHAQSKGIHMLFKTQETENDNGSPALDGGDVGTERKLYYRELVARFAHHHAITWNLGEENTQTTQQQKDMASQFKQLDVYGHSIVLHTYPQQQDLVYDPLLGANNDLTGVSLQTDQADVHTDVKRWILDSAAAGKQWIVSNDEQGHWQIGIPPDNDYPSDLTPRLLVKNVLYGTFMAGGAGVEAYFGYEKPNNDLNMESWRSRDDWWRYGKIALDFFNALNFWDMVSADSLVSSGQFCFAQSGVVYVIYHGSPSSSSQLDLSGQIGTYSVGWMNPLIGGALQTGSKSNVVGGSTVDYGNPPSSSSNTHWVVKVTRTAGTPTPAPTTSAPTTGAPTHAPTTSSPTPAVTYQVVSSGCTGQYSKITSFEECRMAGVLLGFSDSNYRINGGNNKNKKPTYCYYDYDKGHLRYNPIAETGVTGSRFGPICK